MRTDTNGVLKMTVDDTRIVDFIKARMASDFDYAYRVLYEMHCHFALGMYDNFQAMQDFSSRYPRYKSGDCKLSDKQRSYVTSLVTRFAKQYYQMLLRFHSAGDNTFFPEWNAMPDETRRFVLEDYDRTFELMSGEEDTKMVKAAAHVFAVEVLKSL